MWITIDPHAPMKSQLDVKNQDHSRKLDKYWVPIIARTIDLLDCFASAAKPLTLEDAVRLTNIPHTTAYRILHTLVRRDYLNRSGRQYRLNQMRRRLKFGFANLSRQISLAVEIEASLRAAAANAGIDLLVWDNDRAADLAIQNARQMAACKVDLAIEFQLLENVAPVISDIFLRAEIPLISLVNPHHGTVYFGVNNYRAGCAAGLALADYAVRHWKAEIDGLLLLESPRAGRTVQSRLIGALQGVQEKLGPLPEKQVHHLDGGGEKDASRTAVAAFLRPKSRKRLLVAGINDESAIGAVEAAAHARYGIQLAIVGHGGSREIIDLAADPDSPCIGTVSFQPQRYGPDLLDFALPILRGRSAPVGHYVPHEFIGKPALSPRSPKTACNR